ncbi:MAG TPA: pimeloyl-ACP methyl ester esterase BioH [Chitinolyticbacter sp.]|nr:pimeloyl-ACP methyl ester esterase BioH [Chitinolyticbacter sp.]
MNPELFVETRGHGPDVVFLHGWAMNGAVWRPVAEQLADDFCCHLVDLPGHGGSGMVEPYSIDAMVAALDVVFPLPVQVVGWSLGGAVATRWALAQPEKVRSLTLVASSPCFAQRDDWQAAMPLATLEQFASSLQTDWRGTLKRFISLQAMGDASARVVARELTDELFAHGEPHAEALAAALELLRNTDLRGEIARLDLPMLLQYGDKDTLTPLGAAVWLSAQQPNATFITHRGAAHAPFISHLDEFVAVQRRFLAGV